MLLLPCYVQKVKTGLWYIAAQCLGGILGAYSAFKLLPGRLSLTLSEAW